MRPLKINSNSIRFLLSGSDDLTNKFVMEKHRWLYNPSRLKPEQISDYKSRLFQTFMKEVERIQSHPLKTKSMVPENKLVSLKDSEILTYIGDNASIENVIYVKINHHEDLRLYVLYMGDIFQFDIVHWKGNDK